MAKLVRQITQLGKASVEKSSYGYHTLVRGQNQILVQLIGRAKSSSEVNNDVCNLNLRPTEVAKVMQTLSYSMLVNAHYANHYNVTSFDDGNNTVQEVKENDADAVRKLQIGENLSRKEKMNILLNTLLDTKDSKEAIYGALDAFVAWEQNFPIGQLKYVVITLEKEHQWHRVIQVIKWMLSKGQGNTMNTYGQLIRALDIDHRVDEAHEIWVKKIGNDLHSVPWKLGKCMISVYYRSNMMERLVNLFKGFEAFDRKPPEKSIVQKVANAYEILGRMEERDRVLEKYKSLFLETESRKKVNRKKKKQG